MSRDRPDEVTFYICDRHMWFGTTNSYDADRHSETMDCELRERHGRIVWDR